MKRVIISIFLAGLIAALALLLKISIGMPQLNNLNSSTDSFNTIYTSKYGKMSLDQWEMLDYEGNRFKSPEEFLKEIDYYVEAISKYTGKEYLLNCTSMSNKINIFNVYDDISRASGVFPIPESSVSLKNNMFKKNEAPIAHEITHLIAFSPASTSLSEGLAGFMQDTYGKNPAPQNYGLPIHSACREFIQDAEVIKTIGITGMPDIYLGGPSRSRFYMLSHSFVQYLIETYGVEKFFKVYNTSNIYSQFESQYNKKIDELKKEWIEFLKVQEPLNLKNNY